FNHLSNTALFGPEVDYFALLIQKNAQYNDRKKAALEIIDAFNIKIENRNDPYQIREKLHKAEERTKENDKDQVSASSLIASTSAMFNRCITRAKENYEHVLEYAGAKFKRG